MILTRRGLLAGLGGVAAVPAAAQTFRPGFQPGFKSGFQFLAAPAAGGLDVANLFATSLYTGTGAAQTITNGLDLAGQGGLVWAKRRNAADNNWLADTARTRAYTLLGDSTAADQGPSGSTQDLTSFNSNGFSVGTSANANFNVAGATMVSWSFRQHPRFFKVITYTGNGSTQVIPHGLDPSVSVGMVIIKQRDGAGQWSVWHRGQPGKYLLLNGTNAAFGGSPLIFGNGTSAVDPTSSGVTVGGSSAVNGSSNTYVMYVFAHDTASDGVIQCGSFTGAGAISLGWRPQYAMVKLVNFSGTNWEISDTARGWASGTGNDAVLSANTTNAETANTTDLLPTSTGMSYGGSYWGTGQAIYTAIRAVGG